MVAVEEAVEFQSAFLRRAQVERAAAAMARTQPRQDLLEQQTGVEGAAAAAFHLVGLPVAQAVAA
jgi:hypothetical protein